MTRRRAGGILLAAIGAALLGAVGPGVAPAVAAQGGGTVVPVVGDIRPALPAGAIVTVTPDGALAAANTAPTPLAVAAPDGRDFLRISSAGVEMDAANPFTYESRTPPGAVARLPEGVGQGAPDRWVRVSTDASWRWYDARTTPQGVRAPAGGREAATQVLATWSVPMRLGDVPVEVDGRLELHQRSGTVRTVPDPGRDGLDAVVAPGDPPSVILQAPPGPAVTVLGIDDEPFLRRTPDGSWEADSASRTYRLGLLAAGRPVPAVTGWVRYAGPGSVNWSDGRLVPSEDATAAARAAAVPADVARWEIPVLLDDRRVAVTGTARFVPDPGSAGSSTLPGGPLLGLGLAVLLLGGGLGALVLRNRRASGGRDTGGTPDDPAAPPTPDDHPAREGAPLP